MLEDVEISIVDSVSDPTPYENCLQLCKLIIRHFKAQSIPVIKTMLEEIPNLRQQGETGQQIIANLVDILLYLPQTIDEEELPLDRVKSIMEMLYELKNYKYLARVIRKYFTFFNGQTKKECIDLLVQIVSSPISDVSSTEVVYQSALALKTCMS